MTLIELIYAFMFLSVVLFSVIFTLQILFFITQNKIRMTQEELTQELIAVKEQVAKIGTETETLKEKVFDLEFELSQSGKLDESVINALEALKAQVQIVDDLVVDAETETT